MTALVLSNVVLWIVVAALLLVILALARQVGILYERIAPMGALAVQTGPVVGDSAPRFELDDMRGRPQRIGYGGARSQLLFFLSPRCPVSRNCCPFSSRWRVPNVPGWTSCWPAMVKCPNTWRFTGRRDWKRFPMFCPPSSG